MKVYKARHFGNLTRHGRVATMKLSVSKGFQSKITERNCDGLDLKMTSSEFNITKQTKFTVLFLSSHTNI